MREKAYIDELLGRGSSKQTEPQIQGDKGGHRLFLGKVP